MADNDSVSDTRPFLCGVVEGFYGRPWTPEQRKDLFTKQQKWAMNCYLYAPKDDYKHRSYWRELYTVDEAEHMQALIQQATKHNITFYYAISPGLDIVYSNQKEIAALKRKLDQVQRLGCTAFALLFDDVDPEMNGADKEVYQSFAHAQVTVANEIYTYLDQPTFMFCPTQYCSTRSVPTVQTSEYLNTLGSKLAPEIDIMWTGPKVISKTLTSEHIREIASVLRRPPVIWDNLHANDYDQARLFLGPYCGRSPGLKPLLRGVVTNPNCEYGPNFIAIHTLAQWARSVSHENAESIDDAVSADIRLETEGEEHGSLSCPSSLPADIYHPRRALQLALEDWLNEFDIKLKSAGPVTKPQIVAPIPILPSVNTCMSVTPTTPVLSSLPPNIISSVKKVAEVLQDPESNFIPASSALVMNSLASENKVDTVAPEKLPEMLNVIEEPMECVTNGHSNGVEDHMVVEQGSPAQSLGEMSPVSSPEDAEAAKDKKLTVQDLLLLADLFYLPFEHGKMGVTIMTEFNWLKSNSHLVIDRNNKLDETPRIEVQEWFQKAAKFTEITDSVKQMCNRLMVVRNRSLLYELYPYIWDMRGVVSLLNSYVQWLALGQVSTMVSNYVHGNYTWFSKGWREAFMSGDQEPWIFRGGLTAELQRLIPVDASNDLFLYKAPEEVTTQTFVIRPYLATDRDDLNQLILKTAEDGSDGTKLYAAHPELPADLWVGDFLSASASDRVLMVLEGGDGLAGYCFAVTSAKAHSAVALAHREALQVKYPKVLTEEGTMLSACEQLLSSLWGDAPVFPTPSPPSGAPPAPPTSLPAPAPPITPPTCLGDVIPYYPALLSLSLLPSLPDQSLGKRLTTCVLAALRAKGGFGGHACVSASLTNSLEQYARLGFNPVGKQGGQVYVARSF